MFMSKIRQAAAGRGVTVSFVRSHDAALAALNETPPSLVILDLNNPRTDPLGLAAFMRGDPALGAVPTIGFVSHVQTDLIDAARRAGVTEVVARSTFAAQLPDLIAGAT